MNELIQIGPISPLRQRLIDDMTMRRFSKERQRNYLRDVGRFATWLGRSPHTASAEDTLLGGLGVRIGPRGKIDTFTEVEFKKTPGEEKNRPDGLVIMRTGRSVWTALVEAKVGNANLTNDQIEAYLTLAKANNIDAVITLSNQFTPLPTHHPLSISPILTRKVDLFHWSWGHVITQAQLLRDQEEVEDREQLILLSELQRFLLHPSSGVKEFDQLPTALSELCANVAAGICSLRSRARLKLGAKRA
ncbi:hypothetical protein [Sphingopyxis sp. GW247-27LB]|uniref:hypothetical protein n=1 Tax=Sphingopyxis sp. GW247-27LB TaxID=2012632 RepID=UPI0020D11BE7|nr:hypothetical protein [Sphingopyxis sp. GW247-27LB]